MDYLKETLKMLQNAEPYKKRISWYSCEFAFNVSPENWLVKSQKTLTDVMTKQLIKLH